MSASTGMQQCIEICQSCHSTCLHCIQHCLKKGGKHAAADHIRLMADCVQICQVSADFMLRGSPLHMRTCGVCAIVCDECAKDCERIADDDMMKKCADTCRRCAESCRKMASAA